MISEISIKNFKSIEDLTLPLGRVTVLIGENGSGKTNILEAIGFLGAAEAEKLDNEFLWPRGIRNVEPELMVSAFHSKKRRRKDLAIQYRVSAKGLSDSTIEIAYFSRAIRGEWAFRMNGKIGVPISLPNDVVKRLLKSSQHGRKHLSAPDPLTEELLNAAARAFAKEDPPRALSNSGIDDFLVYCPENSVIRPLPTESQIQPLGIRGEGLFPHLRQLLQGKSKKRVQKLLESLGLLQWFTGIEVPQGLMSGEAQLKIGDKYLGEGVLDQRSANEGFLFLLFYFVLFLSPQTPTFFAIDNIDASLNPKLCAELMRRLVKLAKENGKQVILTTHNPGLLDGLDLTDPEQKLYAVSRNATGRTTVRAIPAPVPLRKGDLPLKLSHAFLQGLLGAVPKNF